MSMPEPNRLDGDPPFFTAADGPIEEAAPLRIVETTEGWTPLVEHLAGKHNQKTHGRHHSTAVAATFRDGGYSVNFIGNKPKTGYMVGGMTVITGKYRINKPTTRIVHGATPENTKAAIKDFYKEHDALLRQPGNYLGTWMDGGKMYIDISQRVPTRAKALVLGRTRNELAVYDVRRGTSINIEKFSSWGTETQEWDSTPLE